MSTHPILTSNPYATAKAPHPLDVLGGIMTTYQLPPDFYLDTTPGGLRRVYLGETPLSLHDALQLDQPSPATDPSRLAALGRVNTRSGVYDFEFLALLDGRTLVLVQVSDRTYNGHQIAKLATALDLPVILLAPSVTKCRCDHE